MIRHRLLTKEISIVHRLINYQLQQQLKNEYFSNHELNGNISNRCDQIHNEPSSK